MLVPTARRCAPAASLRSFACLLRVCGLSACGLLLWAFGGSARAQEAAPVDASATPAPAAADTVVTAPPAAASPSVEQRLLELEAEVARLRAAASAAAAARPAKSAEPSAADELETLVSEQGASELSTPPPFRIYGFGEVGLQRAWGSLFDLGLGVTDETTFVLGAVNLFFDFQPEPEWRFLTEVRLTLFPASSPTLDFNSGELSRVDPAVLDASSPNSGFEVARWSGIVLERAQIEYTPLDELNLRAGLFLTPYGIWNIDHGSPARIMIWEPLIVTVGLLNERQLGVELFGRTHILLPWELGYSLYISNGQGEAQVIDPDDDKAVGGRLYVSRTVPSPIQLGVSLYHGSSEKVQQDLGVRPDGSFGLVRTLSERAYTTVAGADFSLDVGGFKLRTEALARWLVYPEGLRAKVLGLPASDTIAFGGYVLGAYRFEPGIEPFLVFEMLRIPLRILEGVVLPGVGVNVYFTPAASLRFQYSYVRTIRLGDDPSVGTGLYLHSVASRLVLAF